MTDREKFEAYFGPVSESMKIHGVEDFEIARRKDQQWQGWQAALASQQPEDDVWIEWAGGECPAPGLMVDIKFENGEISKSELASLWIWKHCRDGDNIIAYRVVKP